MEMSEIERRRREKADSPMKELRSSVRLRQDPSVSRWLPVSRGSDSNLTEEPSDSLRESRFRQASRNAISAARTPDSSAPSMYPGKRELVCSPATISASNGSRNRRTRDVVSPGAGNE